MLSILHGSSYLWMLCVQTQYLWRPARSFRLYVDSPNFLFPECVAGLLAPMSRYPLEMQLLGSVVERWRRSLVEVPPLGI